jgi:hypothetical protein
MRFFITLLYFDLQKSSRPNRLALFNCNDCWTATAALP